MVVEFRRGYLYPEWDVQTFAFFVWGRALVMLLAKRQSVGVVEYRISNRYIRYIRGKVRKFQVSIPYQLDTQLVPRYLHMVDHVQV